MEAACRALTILEVSHIEDTEDPSSRFFCDCVASWAADMLESESRNKCKVERKFMGDTPVFYGS